MKRQKINGDSVKTKAFLLCGAIAGPLFTFAWFVEGATRADYSPLRHPISSLALGDFGWTQDANFIVTGILTLALAVGLRRALQPLGGSTWAPLLVGAIGIGLLGAGIFVTDPLNGYPPGTPDRLVNYSTHGELHGQFSAFVFLGFPAACFVLARCLSGWGERGWAIYSTVTGLAFVVMFLLTGAAFAQAASLVGLAGLFQRITITVGWVWLTLLAFHLLRTLSET